MNDEDEVTQLVNVIREALLEAGTDDNPSVMTPEVGVGLLTYGVDGTLFAIRIEEA